ncbi:VOC family protein [Mesobacterium pallidum]|uniref:VOC family protein n=1 Tax=Mesobacterium pallidum TaxID=2872037 RepID=UPI001EE19E94|nr:VOC family protein [Mesobacterium pallidum]
MPVLAFDHVNVRTPNLEAMIAFYGRVLGMHPGRRPDFDFPGAWLYLGDQALVHLVGIDQDLRGGGTITLEHFALRATGLAEFRDLLEAEGVAHSVDTVPGFPVLQVNFRDPDGNHIHVDFDAAEG